MYALRCCCRRLEEEDTEDKVLRMDLDDIEASLCDAQYEISDIFFVTLEDRVCVVCHENCKSVVFAPCNHLCVCDLRRTRRKVSSLPRTDRRKALRVLVRSIDEHAGCGTRSETDLK